VHPLQQRLLALLGPQNCRPMNELTNYELHRKDTAYRWIPGGNWWKFGLWCRILYCTRYSKRAFKHKRANPVPRESVVPLSEFHLRKAYLFEVYLPYQVYPEAGQRLTWMGGARLVIKMSDARFHMKPLSVRKTTALPPHISSSFSHRDSPLLRHACSTYFHRLRL
jgi:hypothetical protein